MFLNLNKSESLKYVSIFFITALAHYIFVSCAILDNAVADEDNDRSAAEFLSDYDGDGVNNLTELLKGTNPYSNRLLDEDGTSISSPTYTMWNGFLNLINILEISNPTANDIVVKVQIYDIQGNKGASISTRTLKPGEQQDIILNQLKPGFSENSYGLVSLEYQGIISARLSMYKNKKDGSIEFAFSLPVTAPTIGNSWTTFNTFRPNRRADQSNYLVANWLSIVNLDNATKSFKLKYFALNGSLLKEVDTVLNSGQRRDFDGGHLLLGSDAVGSIQIIPNDQKAPYLAQLNRYGYNSSNANADQGFKFAFPIESAKGSKNKVYLSPINSKGDQNWLELLNPNNINLTFKIKIYNESGALVSSNNYTLGAFQQMLLDNSKFFIEGKNSLIEIEPDNNLPIISRQMTYQYKADGTLWSIFGNAAREAIESSEIHSYNLFLGMENYLTISNPTKDEAKLNLSFDNKENKIVWLPAYSTISYPLHNKNIYGLDANTYGTVKITTVGNSRVVTSFLRTSKNSFSFPTKALGPISQGGNISNLRVCDPTKGRFEKEPTQTGYPTDAALSNAPLLSINDICGKFYELRFFSKYLSTLGITVAFYRLYDYEFSENGEVFIKQSVKVKDSKSGCRDYEEFTDHKGYWLFKNGEIFIYFPSESISYDCKGKEITKSAWTGFFVLPALEGVTVKNFDSFENTVGEKALLLLGDRSFIDDFYEEDYDNMKTYLPEVSILQR